LNLEYFIAKRLITARDHKSSISAPIIKIAIAAIAIGMIMMIVSIATGIGLQQKIRQKVAAFNGHIGITNYDENQSQLSITPISTHQDFIQNSKTYPESTTFRQLQPKLELLEQKLHSKE